MCCRFYMEESPELLSYAEAVNRAPLTARIAAAAGRPLKAAGEIRPTDPAAALAPGKDGQTRVFPMIWGFTNPGSRSPVINCRLETAAEKPLWREAWRSHRCVIPASGYYEWEHLADPASGARKTGPKYRIRPKDSSVAYLAGLYRIEERNGIMVPVFAVLTREAAEEIRFIHDRMPVILSRGDIEAWLKARKAGVPDPVPLGFSPA